MIEDMRHLEIFHAHAQELLACIVEWNEKVNGVTDKAELCKIRLAQIAAMREVLHKQKRSIDFMAGNPIEPEVHFAEAVLVGTMGGGAV